MIAAVPPDSIGILVLAAGSSRRFQGDKRQALLPDGRSLLEASLARVPASFTRRLLVLREGDEALAERHGAQGWACFFAREASQGMGRSLAQAMTCTADWQGLLVALGDMPCIRSETYTRLQNLLGQQEIVLPCHAGRRGNPVGFRRQFFAELSRLEGDQGARGLLEKYADRVCRLETGDAGVLRDIDTAEALLTLTRDRDFC